MSDDYLSQMYGSSPNPVSGEIVANQKKTTPTIISKLKEIEAETNEALTASDTETMFLFALAKSHDKLIAALLEHFSGPTT